MRRRMRCTTWVRSRSWRTRGRTRCSRPTSLARGAEHPRSGPVVLARRAEPGSLLPGVELGDVREGARGAAAGADVAVAAFAVWGGEGVRALHDDQLPRVVRDACVVGDLVQP